MKISSIHAHVMGIVGPGGLAPSRNWIFVRVETDQGLVGVGEATTEYHELAVVAMIEQHFAPLLIGQDPTRVHHAWRTCDSQRSPGIGNRTGLGLREPAPVSTTEAANLHRW